MEKIDFNDGWTYEGAAVRLPHDAMITAPRSKDSASTGGNAYFDGGVYHYEKRFAAPADWRGKTALLHFDGVYRKSTVSLNGAAIGGADYGYLPFWVKLDGLKYGEENTLTVTADNSATPNSRWYSGGGIYRPVTLWLGDAATAIHPESVRVTTESCSTDGNEAVLLVETAAPCAVTVLDGDAVVASGETACAAGAANAADGAGVGLVAGGAVVRLSVPHAVLWSAENPHLYTLRVTAAPKTGTARGENTAPKTGATSNAQNGDSYETTFGIRLLSWSPKGFFVNGRETLLRGGCIHHDNGILGAASYKEAEWRKVRMLKEAGYNALRIAHNPASTELLAACDYYGMYVMDEAWDMWYKRKNKADYALDFMQNYKDDLAAIVSRDYNHPSVVMYSIGNEVSEPATERGVTLEREMVDLVRKLDKTRPVTGGFNLMIIRQSAAGKDIFDEENGRDESHDGDMNSLMFNMMVSMVGGAMNNAANNKKADILTTPALDALDIAGYNYASGRYPLDGKVHPNRIVVGSETFPQDLAKNWAMVKKYPYLIGDFMWTAWDYLGEVGSGTWGYTKDASGFQKPYPWLLADMGAIDILGNPTGELYWSQAVWGLLKEPRIAVQPVNHPGVRPTHSMWRGTNAIPSWNWQGCEGNKAVVEVYIDAPKVALYLDGKKLGVKKTKECRAVFKTKYAPGTLKAVALDAAGTKLSEAVLATAATADTALTVRFEKAAGDAPNLTAASGVAAVAAAPESGASTGAAIGAARPGEVLFVPVTMGAVQSVEANADRELSVTVTGGELLAFGSANPRTEERYTAGKYTLYYGRALAVVRAGESGSVTVTATSPSGDSATATLPIQAG